MADLLERPCPLSVHQWKQFQGLWRACRQSAWQGVSIGAAGEQRAPSLGTRAELSEWQQEGFLAGLGGLQGWDPPHARMLLGDSSLPGPLGPSYRPSTPGSPLASKVAPHPSIYTHQNPELSLTPLMPTCKLSALSPKHIRKGDNLSTRPTAATLVQATSSPSR